MKKKRRFDGRPWWEPAPPPPKVSAPEPGWPYGRVYSPLEMEQTPGEPPYHHSACTQCGGYLQGTRETMGICLNCTDGRGWATQPVLGEERRYG